MSESDAVKALIVANEFLESEVCELMQAVSHAYAPLLISVNGRHRPVCNLRNGLPCYGWRGPPAEP
jgi:hypothetical protein